MFQTKFDTTLQMFFIKLNMVFFQTPLKTVNICIFPCAIRYLWFKYFLNLWEKYWHESRIIVNKSCKGFLTKLFKVSEENILFSTGKIPRDNY